MGKKEKKHGKFDLPKEIFVTSGTPENDDAPYLMAHRTAEDACDQHRKATPVGIYKLVEVGEVSTETTYKRKRFTKG